MDTARSVAAFASLLLGCLASPTPAQKDGGLDERDSAPIPPTEPTLDEYPLQHGDSLYKVVDDPMLLKTWWEAEEDCRSNVAHLIVIDGADPTGEIAFVDALDVDGWIGAADLYSEGTFNWVVGPDATVSDALVWQQDEPTLGTRVEDCVAIDDDGRLYDDHCKDQKSYICEFDERQDDVSSYCVNGQTTQCDDCRDNCSTGRMCNEGTQTCVFMP